MRRESLFTFPGRGDVINVNPVQSVPSLQRRLAGVKEKVLRMERYIKQALQVMAVCVCVVVALIVLSFMIPKNAVWTVLIINCLGVGLSVVFVAFAGVVTVLVVQCEVQLRHGSWLRRDIAIEQESDERVRRRVSDSARTMGDLGTVRGHIDIHRLRSEMNNLFKIQSMLHRIPSLPKDSRWSNDLTPKRSTWCGWNADALRDEFHREDGVKDRNESLDHTQLKGSPPGGESPVQRTKSRTNLWKIFHPKRNVSKVKSDNCRRENGVKDQVVSSDHTHHKGNQSEIYGVKDQSSSRKCHPNRNAPNSTIDGHFGGNDVEDTKSRVTSMDQVQGIDTPRLKKSKSDFWGKSMTYFSKKRSPVEGVPMVRSEEGGSAGEQDNSRPIVEDFSPSRRNVFTPPRPKGNGGDPFSTNATPTRPGSTMEKNGRDPFSINIPLTKPSREEAAVKLCDEDDWDTRMESMVSRLVDESPRRPSDNHDWKPAAFGLESQSTEVQDGDCLTPKRPHVIGLKFPSNDDSEITDCTSAAANTGRVQLSSSSQDGRWSSIAQGGEPCTTDETDPKLQEDAGFQCVVRLRPLPPCSPHHAFDCLN